LSTERKQRFEEFVSWFEKHIVGDEKGEGQIFLERFLQSFGNKGIREVGAICEDRVKKKSGSTGFADLVWKPRMILELKKRGENLSKHYDQGFEYWISLVPNRPRYMVLCNFDEFWIYDLNTQINDPIHKLDTKNLPNDWGSLAFLFPKPEEPVFNNNNVEVTKQAAEIIGTLFVSLTKRKIDPLRAQRFVLQLVVALFAEDVDLIPKYTLNKILKDAVANSVIQTELTDLFKAMSTDIEKLKAKKYKDIAYFNGGLFNEVNPVELLFTELDLLYQASKQDWSKVRPSIFGSIFESSMDTKKRHSEGVHFTSELDILKIVYPTIVRPFRVKIENAKTKKDLLNILVELQDFKVLDPACGSGNFLYIAYRELVRIEMDVTTLLYEKYSTKKGEYNPANIGISRISSKNFFGIDTNGFGIELAKISLSIGRKLAADEFLLHDNILPFENLDSNIICNDALFVDWPKTDVIVGNPPFLGGKYLRDGRGDEYAEKVYQAFPEVKGQPDFCTFWFRKAVENPAKRVGFVGTNSISQNVSRVAGLDYVLNNNGKIINAISTQEWSGEANVHVSIVNWIKDGADYDGRIILDDVDVSTINSSLKAEFNYTSAPKIESNTGLSFEGIQIAGKGFIISLETAKMWIKADKKNKNILKPMHDGSTLVSPSLELAWVIDFNNMSLEVASTYKLPYEHVKKFVKPERDINNEKSRKEFWWKFGRSRPVMRKALEGLTGYFCLPKVAKYTCFRFIDISILPCEANMVVASDDFFILGILNSKIHLDWVEAQRSTLKSDTRYTNTTCFETFPFPVKPTEKQKEEVRKIMTELENFRVELAISREKKITDIYNDFYLEPTSQLYKLHRKLDRCVAESYGWKYIEADDYKQKLFDLNRELTS